MVTTPASIIPNTCGASASGTPKREERWCSSPTSSGCRPRPSAHSTKAAGKACPREGGGRTVLQMDQTASADQTLLRDIRKCREDPNLDRRLGLRPRRHHQEAARPGRLALHTATDPLGHPLRENAYTSSTCPRRSQMRYFANN